MTWPDEPALAQFVADGRPGGGTTMVLGLIDDLRAHHGLPVTLISQPGSYLEAQARERGLPFVGLDLFRLGIDPSLPWRLSRLLGSRRFAATHVHGLRAAHTAVRWPVRQKLGRIVYTVHGLHQLHLPTPVRVLANVAERQVMRRVDQVVFVAHADAQAAQAHRLLSRQAEVIYNGIALQDMRPLPVAQRDVDVVYIARHVEQKNPLFAARVLRRLAAAGRRCVMAGGGPLQPAARELLEDKRAEGRPGVPSLGELHRDEALDLLARARLLIMPSRWEGLPILPIEAMALGVPVLASQLPGTAEVVDHQNTGWLLGSDDEDAWVQAAQRLLDEPAQWSGLQLAGLERAAALFNRISSSQAYLRLYQLPQPAA